MRAGELQDPVGYSGPWLPIAVLALAVVVLYYAVVLWWLRPRRERPARPVAPRAATLARLDAIAASVAAGELPARQGHQMISETVRGFVADASGLPARTMTLSDLEAQGPERLASVVALVYPPEFGPGDALPAERFSTALGSARQLVEQW